MKPWSPTSTAASLLMWDAAWRQKSIFHHYVLCKTTHYINDWRWRSMSQCVLNTNTKPWPCYLIRTVVLFTINIWYHYLCVWPQFSRKKPNINRKITWQFVHCIKDFYHMTYIKPQMSTFRFRSLWKIVKKDSNTVLQYCLSLVADSRLLLLYAN